MAATALSGHSVVIGAQLSHAMQGPQTDNATISGNPIAISWNGSFWFPDRSGSKTITAVGFRFGTVVKAGGSGLTLSLQDPSYTVAGPDGTQDQTCAIVNGDAGFTSNVWYTASLGSTRSVAFGERLCVVLEWDGSGRLGADTASVTTWRLGTAAQSAFMSSKSSGGVWSANAGGVADLMNIVFECADGSVATLYGAVPSTSLESQISVAADAEYALEFGLNRDCMLDGAAFIFSNNYASPPAPDCVVTLYDCHDLSQSYTFKAHWQYNVSGGNDKQYISAIWPGVTCLADRTYRLAVRPAIPTAGYYTEVADAAHLACYVGGTSWRLAERATVADCWTITATRRPWIHPILAGL